MKGFFLDEIKWSIYISETVKKERKRWPKRGEKGYSKSESRDAGRL